MISKRAEWLEPFMQNDRITLYHKTSKGRIPQIKSDGLKIPYSSDQKNWGWEPVKALFAYVPCEHSLTPYAPWLTEVIRFAYPISKVNIRGIGGIGIPLIDYLEKEQLLKKDYRGTGAIADDDGSKVHLEFLIFEDVPREMLEFVHCDDSEPVPLSFYAHKPKAATV